MTTTIDTFEFANTEIREMSPEESAEYGGFGIPLKGVTSLPAMQAATLTLKGITFCPVAEAIFPPVPEFTPEDIEHFETVRVAVRALIEKLDVIPTPKKIAHFLRDEHVLGTPRDSHDCPLANYFNAMTQQDIAVHEHCISTNYNFIQEAHTANGVTITTMREVRIHLLDMPSKLVKFVNNFDKGRSYLYLNRHLAT